ncbi:Ger(x)C family spore germination protein [Alkalicoccobacillus gibsonii]|uniref:Ger(x)C family spore germination protein n=1 Tax=Alkalicoccobacillus gibsonii TaxID=79881 RepID=UPI001932448C|nr:Ger(x)C family spore germination protein [Alkalicoccobacillus gibsonii]MBM0064853.1 Ger(x)C family spore germination protein [Alkalicoccobacillus gibsonii]
MRKIKCLCSLLIMAILLAGCWDSRSIEDISLVIGVGIDLEEDSDNIALGHQIIVPPSNGGDSSQGSPFKNIYTSGKTVHSAIRNLALRDDPVYSDHQRILLIHNKVLQKYRLDEVINQLVKDDKTRRSLYVFTTDESIKKIFSTTDRDEIPSNQLYSLIENRSRSTKILPSVSLGKVSSNLQKKVSFVLQNVEVINNQIALAGGAIISDGKIMNQELSVDDIATLNWLTGRIEGGVISTEEDSMPLAFEILDDVKVKVKSEYKNDRIYFTVHSETEGRISEDWNEEGDSFKEAYSVNRERAVEEEIKNRVVDFIRKLQTEIQADVIGFSEYVKVQQPDFWKEHKEEWNRYFSESDISFSVSVTAEDFGTKGSIKKRMSDK